MKKYDKNKSFKCDEELDKRKKPTLEDLKRSLDNCF